MVGPGQNQRRDEIIIDIRDREEGLVKNYWVHSPGFWKNLSLILFLPKTALHSVIKSLQAPMNIPKSLYHLHFENRNFDFQNFVVKKTSPSNVFRKKSSPPC